MEQCCSPSPEKGMGTSVLYWFSKTKCSNLKGHCPSDTWCHQCSQWKQILYNCGPLVGVLANPHGGIFETVYRFHCRDTTIFPVWVHVLWAMQHSSNFPAIDDQLFRTVELFYLFGLLGWHHYLFEHIRGTHQTLVSSPGMLVAPQTETQVFKVWVLQRKDWVLGAQCLIERHVAKQG